MRRALVGVVLGGVLIGLLFWRSGSGSRQLRHYAPDEYVERAEQFIRAGYLVADCSGDPMRLEPRLAEAPAYEKSWYEDSYLSTDVARFNADPEGFGWAFVIDNDCRLRGVNPVVHAIELPFVERFSWLGHILYRGEGSDAVLRSAKRSITLLGSDTLVSTRDQALARVGDAEEVVKEGVVLMHFAGGPGQPAARLFPVGDQVVVHNRVRAQRPEAVRLMGHQLPVGMMSRLETGDWLHFEADRPSRTEETFVYVGGEAFEAASSVRRQNERFQRKTEDSGLGMVVDSVRETASPFLDQVARSLDTVLRILPRDRAASLTDAFDLQLTVQRDLQLRLSQVFHAYADQQRRAGDHDPFAAGVTVMDGVSGEILALATYPHESDLEGESLSVRGRRRLLRNQNFVRHPIGSAIKPFFFAAIADTYPALLGLEVGGHEDTKRHREIFQCEIPTGYQLLGGHGERVDFARALEVSCNKYTVELATLALAMDGAVGRAKSGTSIPRDETVEWPLAESSPAAWIGGRPIHFAPDFSAYLFADNRQPTEPESGAAVRCLNLDRFEQVRYRGALARLTGAATYRGELPQGLPDEATRRQLERGYTTNRYDLSIWRPLLEYLLEDTSGDDGWKIRSALQEISPDRVNLAFNQVSELRGDYISLLLGGGSSVWTNIQLAEALSRLVTDRSVEARLGEKVLPRDNDSAGRAAESFPAELGAEEADTDSGLGLDPAARRAVLEGLRRVVDSPDGTAWKLHDELEALRRVFPEDRIELYSKTGSPVLERTVPSTVASALESLVTRDRLTFSGGVLTVRSEETTARHRRSGVNGRRQYLAALRAAVREVRSGADNRTLRGVRRIIDRFAEDLRRGRWVPGQPDGPLTLEAGVLRLNRQDSLFQQRLVRDMGSVYVFSVVRRPADGSEPRVLTVAVHLEVGPDSSVAVGAAEAILPELARILE